MARHTEPDSAVTRRTVLAGLGSAVGTLAATDPVVGQQDGITGRALLPAVEGIQAENLPGYFVHVDPNPNPVEASFGDECAFADWPADETVGYQILLIDRKDDDHYSMEMRLYVPDDRSVPGGTLYVVNGATQCAGEYVGVELERMAADTSVLGEVAGGGGVDTPDDQTETTQTAADGGGFGTLAALAGLAGAGALARWRDEE